MHQGPVQERYRAFVAEGHGGLAAVGAAHGADLSGFGGVHRPASAESGDSRYPASADAGAAAVVVCTVSAERGADAADPLSLTSTLRKYSRPWKLREQKPFLDL